jgi:hypothetical protein
MRRMNHSGPGDTLTTGSLAAHGADSLALDGRHPPPLLTDVGAHARRSHNLPPQDGPGKALVEMPGDSGCNPPGVAEWPAARTLLPCEAPPLADTPGGVHCHTAGSLARTCVDLILPKRRPRPFSGLLTTGFIVGA